MDINKIQSKLSMKNFYFPKLEVIRDKNIENGKMDISLNKNIQFGDSNSYILSLTMTIAKPDLKVYVEAVGNFAYTDDLKDEDFLVQNAIAIMFPFIRSEVTLLTSQPNMSPIVIPPINVNSLINEMEQNKQ